LNNTFDLDTYLKKIQTSEQITQLEEIKVHIFGKNGILTQQFKSLRDLQGDEKKEFAKNLNEIKESLNTAFDETFSKIQDLQVQESLKKEAIDPSLFSQLNHSGAMHPISETTDTILEYFSNLNFTISEGPLVEDDFHNFEALNVPFYHPARDMQDTFYFKDNKLLRTHTSPVQIRTMLKEKPPIRIISPGAVFRKDYDITHTPMFHQVEGLVVDEKHKISFANLKYILEDFLKHIFGDIEVRFRPSFFPFTEPSSEVDISCVFCNAKGCRVCSHTGWLEVLGCGIVDENVFKSVGYENVSGYAFGLGVERFTMLIKKIPDLRMMFEGDLRLLGQFQ
jgi:phenylalanyl-tRNA synthetase alpha chain